MPVDPIYPAVYLRRKVDEQFALDQSNVQTLFGEREVTSPLESNRRIVFVPGDPDGAVGEVRPPVEVGSIPTRDVAEIRERTTLFIFGNDADPALAQDDEAQYQEVRLILDAVIRVLNLHFFGRHRIVSAKHIAQATAHGRFGAGIRVVVEMSAKVPDLPLSGTPENQLVTEYGNAVSAKIDVSELSVTEQLVVPGYHEEKPQ